MNRLAPPPPRWLLRVCARLYADCVAAPGAPDKVIAKSFRESRLDEKSRGFVADVVKGMLRARGLLEAGLRHLGPADPEQAPLFFLRARRATAAGRFEQGLDRALAAAERETDGIDLWLPAWLRGRLPRDLLKSLASAPPVTLRANLLRTAPGELAEWLADEGIATRPTRWSPWGLTLEARANVFRTRAFREGLFEMQDEGSQLVALLCGAPSGGVVVDGCAGAGGKTLALAAMMGNRGSLHALDTAEFRLQALRERAKRAGVANLRVHARAAAGSPLPRGLAGRADVVLVDAPCSGTGVLRRNPDLAWKLSEEDVARLAGEQASLLRAYAPLVNSGGRLVYAVCSLLPAEGAEQVARFLREQPDFRRVDAADIFREAELPSTGLVSRGDLRVDPARHGCDGFFAAVLARGR
jgi:16S rRNA (cytosine967-C5)-methyltransferase